MDGPAPAILNGIEDALGVHSIRFPCSGDIFVGLTIHWGSHVIRPRGTMSQARAGGCKKARFRFTRERRVQHSTRYPMERLLDVLRANLS